jgi:amino acid transporter
MTDELGKRLLQADGLAAGEVSQEAMEQIRAKVRLASIRSRRMLWLTLVAWCWAAYYLAFVGVMALFRAGYFQSFIGSYPFMVLAWTAVPGLVMLPLGVAFGVSYLIRSRGARWMQINARLMQLEKTVAEMAQLQQNGGRDMEQ